MEASFSLMAGRLWLVTTARWIVIVYVGAQPSLAMFTWALAWWKGVPYVVSIQISPARPRQDVGNRARIQFSGQAHMERFEYASLQERQAARWVL